MNNFLGPGVVLTALFLSAGYTIYTFIRASHLERMAKIEKGIDTASSFNNTRYLELKTGMLMVGIAFGLLLAYFLEEILNVKAEVFYPSFMLFFGGISLIGAFFWGRHMSKKK